MNKKDEKKKILVIISSKNPKKILIENINNIYKFIVSKEYNFKICIVDSESSDFSVYNIIKDAYPMIELHFVKNKNYEYGAYKYGFSLYPNYDIYICLQDTLLLTKEIDLSKINDETCYSFDCYKGFKGWGAKNGEKVKHNAYALLKNCDLTYKDKIHGKFNLVVHNSFFVSNHVIKDIFKTLINPPITKTDSGCYERIFGLYFIKKNIKTINLQDYVKKFHGNRM